MDKSSGDESNDFSQEESVDETAIYGAGEHVAYISCA